MGHTLPGHLRLPLRLFCVPLATPFPAHLAPCRHPCLMPSPVPGLRHTSRRWNAPRTPMSLGSVFPPPGLVVVGMWGRVEGGGAEGPALPREAERCNEYPGSRQSYF